MTSNSSGRDLLFLHSLGLPFVWCRQVGKPPPQDPSQEVFLAFGRVFSGVLKDGQSVHVLSAAYNPAQPQLQRQVLQVCLAVA